jgi:hypothetical protein
MTDAKSYFCRFLAYILLSGAALEPSASPFFYVGDDVRRL